MPVFGRKSSSNLETCHKDLYKIALVAIESYDFSIITGHRSEEEQDRLFEMGLSKVEYPDSKHNSLPSMAFDLAPYPINWRDINRFLVLGGRIMQAADILRIKLRWGADWNMNDNLDDQTFFDYGHFETFT